MSTLVSIYIYICGDLDKNGGLKLLLYTISNTSFLILISSVYINGGRDMRVGSVQMAGNAERLGSGHDCQEIRSKHCFLF